MTGSDIFNLVIALLGLGVSGGFWWAWLRAVRKRELRVPPGAATHRWLILVGLTLTASAAWAAFDHWRDPWHLHHTPRLKQDNAHGWSLAVFYASVVPLGLAFVFIGHHLRRMHVSSATAVANSRGDILPASRAECEVLLEQLKDDALWAKGNHAVAAYLINIMLRNMNSDDAWDSDMPLWDALRPELMRRFPTPEQREAAAEAIQAEYVRLFEHCP